MGVEEVVASLGAVLPAPGGRDGAEPGVASQRAVLELVRRAACARDAFWVRGAGDVVSARGRTRLAQRLDGRVLGALRPGAVERLGPDRLRRSPRLSALAAEHDAWLLLCATDAALANGTAEGVLGLWLTGGNAAFPDERAREACELVARHDALARRLVGERDAEGLTRIGRRAAHLAHDLRHQLTLARLTLEEAQLAGRADADAALAVGRVLATASELCAASLEEASRAGGTPGRGEPARCELLSVLHDAGHAASRIGARDDVRVHVRCPEGIVVGADRTAVLRAFVNLALNAVEASPRGGIVRLEASLADGLANSRVRARVSDEGRGSPELEGGGGAVAPRRRPGRGFGLDSVRATLAELGGRLSVEPRERGTTMVVELPRRAEHRAEVLVVDPDPRRRARVAAGLEREGHRVLDVATPGEAVRTLVRQAVPPAAVGVASGTPGAELGRLVELARQLDVRCVALTGAPERRAGALSALVRDEAGRATPGS